MNKRLFLIISLLVVGLACRVHVPGGEFPPTTPTPLGPTPTPVFFGVTGTPQVKATNTPLPPPSTPTPRPSPTPIPTEPPTPTVEAETGTAEAEAAPDTTPTPAATPTETPIPSTEMVTIPGGSFTMGYNAGLPDEGPEHEVELEPYQIDIFEVTNRQFEAFVEATGYETDAEKSGSSSTWRTEYTEDKESFPVVRVSWNDAQAYCEWVGKRLPTEAEWEKAARGPQNYLYPWGDTFDPAKVNAKASGFRSPVTVGTYGEGISGFGVYDMAGNVWEWTASWYGAYPGNATGSPYYGQQFRVLRGGGWFDTETELRSTRRSANVPTAANDDIGFRCARSTE